VGRIGSGVRVSVSFQKNARLVGRLESVPRLVADRADVMAANRVRQGRCTHARYMYIKETATVTMVLKLLKVACSFTAV